jgi:hypothetical protein
MKFDTTFFFFLIACLTLAGCATESSPTQSRYLRWVGDSKFDPALDTDDFELCYNENGVKQYFNHSQGLQYKGEKPALLRHFFNQYQAVDNDQSGWIRIRFIVNCEGKTGRFRITESDESYRPRSFDARITRQLEALTRSLDGWKKLPDESNPEDYYQYLVFKIRNGNLEEIMP